MDLTKALTVVMLPGMFSEVERAAADAFLGPVATQRLKTVRRDVMQAMLDSAALHIHHSTLVNNMYDRHRLAEEVRRLPV
jgi:hypothetical protein